MDQQPSSQQLATEPPAETPQPPAQPPTDSYSPAPQSRGGRRALAICGVVIVVVASSLGAGAFGAWLAQQKSSPLTNQKDGNSVVSNGEVDVSQVVNRVSPSVVSITTQTTGSSRYGRRQVQSAGTGIIISANGYVMTNKHVVGKAQRLQITKSDGTQYSHVKLVGADPLNDVAFLKIEGAKDLVPAQLGDSGTTRVGQQVIAIGNSLGRYQNTVTSGVISGKGRPVQASSDNNKVESLIDLLQTDAAINPGNSGGPLLNLAGQVIGINTAVVSEAQSVGFAIPINATKGLVRSVLETGKVQKGYVGVYFTDITPDIRVAQRLPVSNGALISRDRASSDSDEDDETTSGSRRSHAAVEPGSPADKAGLREGDIITKVNDKKVGEQGGFGSLISEFRPGETVSLTVLRQGKEQKVSLTLSEYKQSADAAQ